MSTVSSVDLDQLPERVAAPISDVEPTGAKAVYDDDFMAVKERIDSLGTLSGSINQEKALSDEEGSIFEDADTSNDFTFIVDVGTRILTETSKDLRIASYVALSLYRTDGFQGLATGLEVVQMLVTTYWDDLYPVPRRMKARGSAIGFLTQRLSSALDEADNTTVDDHQALVRALEIVEELQPFLMEKMGEHAPVTSKLKRHLEETLRNTPEPEPESTNDAPDEAEADDAEYNEGEDDEAEASALADDVAASSVSSNSGSTHDVEDGQNQDAAESQDVSKRNASAPGSSAPNGDSDLSSPRSAPASQGATGPLLTSDASETEIVRVVVRAAGKLRDANRTDARPYRLVRSVRWDPMQEPPPNDGGSTRIQPPTAQRCAYLRDLLNNGDTATLIQQAEDSFQQPPFHFWLDLQRLLVRAMEAEGAAYAAPQDAVTRDVVQLAVRVPGLIKLRFADGTPFAEAETRAWIDEEVAAATASGGGPVDVVDEVVEEARKQMADGGLEAALAHLRHAPTPGGQRDVARVRTARGALCLRANRPDLARPLLESLVDDIDIAGLDGFDRTVAVEAWCTLYRAYAQTLDALESGSDDNLNGTVNDEGANGDASPGVVLRRKAEKLYDRICAAAPSHALALSPLTAS